MGILVGGILASRGLRYRYCRVSEALSAVYQDEFTRVHQISLLHSTIRNPSSSVHSAHASVKAAQGPQQPTTRQISTHRSHQRAIRRPTRLWDDGLPGRIRASDDQNLLPSRLQLSAEVIQREGRLRHTCGMPKILEENWDPDCNRYHLP